MDIKSIIVGMVAVSVIWLIISLKLLAYSKRKEDGWYRTSRQIIDHYERACDRLVQIIRNGDHKDITDDEVYHIKYFT